MAMADDPLAMRNDGGIDMLRNFRLRRQYNWLSLAALYGSFYALRYNFSLANKSIADQFHFTNEQMGAMITGTAIAYAVGQFVNGPIVDRFGGKRMMLFGAGGTILANLLFGINAYSGVLNLFIAVWVLNGYMQAFGSPGNLKVNGHWFSLEERGLFSGVFTAVVYLGRLAIMVIGPLLIVHAHWQWVFLAPAIFTVLTVLVVLFVVRETPCEAGFDVDYAASRMNASETRTHFFTALGIVLRNKNMWLMGSAYFCLGIVRNGLEQWFPKYLAEAHQIAPGSVQFGAVVALMPIAALLGAISAGAISDRFFQSRRAPVVALMFFAQALLLLFFTFSVTPIGHGVLLLLLSFMFSGPHAIIGSAVAMDFGGKEATGTAHGFVDAMQYCGAAMIGVGMGRLLDLFGWDVWGPSLMLFAVAGGLLLLPVWNVRGR